MAGASRADWPVARCRNALVARQHVHRNGLVALASLAAKYGVTGPNALCLLAVPVFIRAAVGTLTGGVVLWIRYRVAFSVIGWAGLVPVRMAPIGLLLMLAVALMAARDEWRLRRGAGITPTNSVRGRCSPRRRSSRCECSGPLLGESAAAGRGRRPSRFTPAADNCGMFDSLELLDSWPALPERKFVPAEPRVIENEIQRVSDATAALGERLTAGPTPVANSLRIDTAGHLGPADSRPTHASASAGGLDRSTRATDNRGMIEFLLTEILPLIIWQIVRRVPYRPKTMSLSRGLRFVPAEPAERKIKRVSDATAANS